LKFNHTPVLLNECIKGLNIKPDGIYVDGTLGGAGHSKEIALIGIDRDEEAICVAKERLKEFEHIKFVHDNHDNIKEILEELEIDGADGILLDLGVSSYQLDERNRGFSYMGDARLDMRMDKSQSLDAEEVINTYSEEELAKIIFEYGEEKFARKIAKNICLERKNGRIETTSKLVEIIEKSVPKKGDGHPAKRTFQAIRIEVNNEIKPLYNTIKNSIDALKPGGRLCVITFHSLEDRAVKNAMIDCEGRCICPPRASILQMWNDIIRKDNNKKANNSK
jgi:16S rRNA (cytosine1402-N4)-methyltransferase